MAAVIIREEFEMIGQRKTRAGPISALNLKEEEMSEDMLRPW